MRQVYIIVNSDSGQAYAGLTKDFTTRICTHKRRKPQLFAGEYTVSRSAPMSEISAQQLEKRAVHFLRSLGFNTLNIAPTGALGAPEELYWTTEKIRAVALKYSSRGDFKRDALPAYKAAQRNRCLDAVCVHMSVAKRPNGFWTKDRCSAEASRYSRRNDFKKGIWSAYKAARDNGWLNDICSHMIDGRKVRAV